jgi:hypothetical protein
LPTHGADEIKEEVYKEGGNSKTPSLAQLVGGVDVRTQHLSSNPHGRELRFLFILEAHAFLGTHAIYLEDQVSSLFKIKNPGTHA